MADTSARSIRAPRAPVHGLRRSGRHRRTTSARAPRRSCRSPGWVEHDPIEIAAAHRGSDRRRDAQRACPCRRPRGHRRHEPARDNGRLEPENRRALDNAIVWQDTRTDRIVAGLERDGQGAAIRDARPVFRPRRTFRRRSSSGSWKTSTACGAPPTGARRSFGTIDTWIIWNLTGGPDGGVHVTDVTNASRTHAHGSRTLDWDDELLALFGVPRSMLPEIRPSSDRRSYGMTRAAGPTGGEVPICGGPRRSAGGDGRAGLLRARRGQEHVRHRQLHAPQHRDPPSSRRSRDC